MVRMRVDSENGGHDVIKLSATLSYLKRDARDDLDVQEKWTPPDGCTSCESPHGNEHIVRCEARRYEYHLKL